MMQCDRTISPVTISELRSKKSAMEQREEITGEDSKRERGTIKTSYGLRDGSNSMHV